MKPAEAMSLFPKTLLTFWAILQESLLPTRGSSRASYIRVILKLSKLKFRHGIPPATQEYLTQNTDAEERTALTYGLKIIRLPLKAAASNPTAWPECSLMLLIINQPKKSSNSLPKSFRFQIKNLNSSLMLHRMTFRNRSEWWQAIS